MPFLAVMVQMASFVTLALGLLNTPRMSVLSRCTVEVVGGTVKVTVGQ